MFTLPGGSGGPWWLTPVFLAIQYDHWFEASPRQIVLRPYLKKKFNTK
jgi:hypothetical protein